MTSLRLEEAHGYAFKVKSLIEEVLEHCWAFCVGMLLGLLENCSVHLGRYLQRTGPWLQLKPRSVMNEGRGQSLPCFDVLNLSPTFKAHKL
jgi:hypothetical protein